jgi:N-acetylglucosaminyldiphosphoundecaprenol N-acetyl-beta-D-mannosaminyltransferase
MKALSPVSGTSTDTVSFLGLTLQPKSLHEMNLLVEEGVRDHRNWIIANHNLHSLYLLHRHPELREFYSGVQWTHIDGMPLVALGRLYGYPLERRHRVTLVDGMARLPSWLVQWFGRKGSRPAANTVSRTAVRSQQRIL